ncbi:hypothetical protein CLOP_g11331 [Closterium sp. NIES-67]|nr:hypothetical protein CLOP_g11331 [Closterium sp. NIES-67]
MLRSSLTWPIWPPLAAVCRPGRRMACERVQRALPAALALCLAAVLATTPLAMVGAQPFEASQAQFLEDCRKAWSSTFSGWDGRNTNCNTAMGIKCDRSGMILQISPPASYMASLGGPIPKSISNLRKLTYLDLQSRSLTGSIPNEIGSLTNLAQLYLYDNHLTGSIPSGIGNLKNLELLQLRNNQLNFIPDAVGNLTNLLALYLQDNQFAGSIPSTIVSLAKLQVLYLGNNQLTGSIPAVDSLTDLETLDLYMNQLTGSIFSTIGSLKKLEYLNLRNNQLSGPIPDSIGTLTAMKQLSLEVNQLTGSIPTTIGSFKEIEALSLRRNLLTGSVPVGISSFSIIKYLFLEENKLEGDLPKGIFNLVSLQKLGLQGNRFGGSIPNAITRLTTLSYLTLSFNQLYGSIPAALTGMTKLTECDLSHNYLTGPLVKLPLVQVKLSHNYLSGLLLNSDCTQPQTLIANCFTLPEGCSSSVQRPAAECLAFCGVSNTTAACGGHGTCYPDGPSFAPTCLCEPGFLQLGTINCASPGWNQSFDGPILPPSTVLTNGTQQETAGKFMAKPVTLFAYPAGPSPGCGVELAFSANFTFSLTPKSGTVATNGFAFVIMAKAQVGSGRVGFAGVGNRSIAVVFDTQYSMFKFESYVGLNVDGNDTPLVKKASVFRLVNGSIYTAWVDYQPEGSGTIQVFLAASAEKPAEPLLQWSVALCEVLQASAKQQAFFFGFVASTTFTWNPFLKTVIRSSAVRTGIPPPKKVVIGNEALGLSISTATFAPSGASPFSRYVSAGYSLSNKMEDSWLIRDEQTWDSVPFLGWPVKNQGTCSACWAYAVVASVEAAYGIATQQTAPLLSVEPLFAAMGLTQANKCTAGGSPTVAFEKLITLPAGTGLTGGTQSAKWYPVQAFERTRFKGYVGLMLAVQHQPVVVHIEASAPTFRDHNGTFKYMDAGCYTGNLNHVVLVIGYSVIVSDASQIGPPFWIIRNSWGDRWGDKGHMRMDIQGGNGVCGINVLPGIYPVIKIPEDPCSQSSYQFDLEPQPSMNPCGRFPCQALTGGGNKCSCSISKATTQPFVEVGNGNGSNTCAYVQVCQSYFSNPCSTGTCINDGRGSYSCICPPNYVQSTTEYNTPTCDPVNTTATTMTVSGDKWRCSDVYQLVGLSLDQFKLQNKAVDCTQPLTKGSVLQLNGTPTTPCTAFFYSLNGDNCASIGVKLKFDVSRLTSLNPGLDCSGVIQAGGSVCVERNAALAYMVPVCTSSGVLTREDTCDRLLQRTTTAELYRNNPGLTCSPNIPSSASAVGSKIGVEVCLSATYWPFKEGLCTKGRMKNVKPSLACSAAYRFYDGSIAKFADYNRGKRCSENIGSTNYLCVP